ncbi:MAG: hypothetical protein ACR2QM_13875 [Longimicrobiales bacterium]
MPKNRLLLVGLVMSGLLLSAQGAEAQLVTGGHTGLSQSLSDTKDFASELSFRNAGLETRYMASEGLSFGVSFSWSVFHEQIEGQEDLAQLPVTITGTQFRTVNTLPLLVTAHKYFGAAPQQTRPYVGVGLGTAWTQRRLDIGVLSADNASWGFAAVPEVGLLIPLSAGLDLAVHGKYLWTSSDPGAQTVSFGIGLLTKSF